MSFLTRSKRLILTLSLSAIIPCAQASNDTITLGVSSRVPNVNEDLILKTERVLTDHFGPKNFRIVHYSLDGLVEAIKEGEVDIFLSSAGLYRRMSSEGVRDLVALASPRFPDPNHSEGSAFIVRNDRTDLQSIKDLKGKILAANSPTGFSGYQIDLYEILRPATTLNVFSPKQFSPGKERK